MGHGLKYGDWRYKFRFFLLFLISKSMEVVLSFYCGSLFRVLLVCLKCSLEYSID